MLRKVVSTATKRIGVQNRNLINTQGKNVRSYVASVSMAENYTNILKTKVNKNSEEFKANQENLKKVTQHLKDTLNELNKGKVVQIH